VAANGGGPWNTTIPTARPGHSERPLWHRCSACELDRKYSSIEYVTGYAAAADTANTYVLVRLREPQGTFSYDGIFGRGVLVGAHGRDDPIAPFPGTLELTSDPSLCAEA